MTVTSADITRTRAVAAYLTARDVRVVWRPGWDTRGVDLPFGPARAHVCHWDASSILSGEWGALAVVEQGRGGANPVPGPLAQYQGARCLDGVPKIAIVAAGRCNHAGTGGPYRLADGTVIPQDSGNRWAVGSEWAWAGPTESPTAASLYAYDVLAAAHAEVLDIPTLSVISHEEWTQGNPWVRAPRKADIGATISRVRRNAQTILMTQQGDDVSYSQWSAADRTALVTDVTSAVIRAVTRGEMPDKARPAHLVEASTGRIREVQDLIRLGDEPTPATGDTHPANLENMHDQLSALTDAVEVVRTQFAALLAALDAEDTSADPDPVPAP